MEVEYGGTVICAVTLQAYPGDATTELLIPGVTDVLAGSVVPGVTVLTHHALLIPCDWRLAGATQIGC